MKTNQHAQFILGGARSGKSRYAESLAKQSEHAHLTVCYIATAQPYDNEMQQRITQHQQDRPARWKTVEVKTDLASELNRAQADTCLLIDCLTLWQLNILEADCVETETKRFLTALQTTPAHVICVSNEIGMGVIPMGKLTRQYVDALGRLHQQVAQICNQVTLMVAGLPMKVK